MNAHRLVDGHFYLSNENEIYSGAIDKGFFICGFNEVEKKSFFYFKSNIISFQKEADFIFSELKNRNLDVSRFNIKCIVPLDLHEHTFFSEPSWSSVHLVDPNTIEREFFFYVQTGRLRVRILSQQEPTKAPLQAEIQKRIKVLIIDDSVTIHKLLHRLLSKSSEIEVVGAVSNPLEAMKVIKQLKPDVLTVDIHMAPTDGVSLLKEILPEFPIPALIVSSLSLQDGPFVLDALAAGAVDYIQKPSIHNLESFAQEILEKIKTASMAKVKMASATKAPVRMERGTIDENALVLMGASTGGTEALASILSQLPKDIPPILIVQHIPASFSSAFAARLDQMCPFKVVEVQDGMKVESNTVYIAPGGLHTRLHQHGGRLSLQVYDAAPVNRHRPSVDVLFESVVNAELNRTMIAILLTGMGSDGAQGLLKLKKAGALTAAQDKESCVVYGMPKVAVEIGATATVLPLEQIPKWLCSSFMRKKRAS